MLTIEIEGLDQLEEELRSLGSSVSDTLEDAVLAGGMIIQEQAEANAPYVSGNLKGSIGTWVTTKEKSRVEGEVGSRNCEYARIQEYGGVTGRGGKTRITGKFYMTRAAEEKQTEAENQMVEVITQGFNR